MDITLYEKYNADRLRQVLECGNLPFDSADDNEWREKFKQSLKKYSKLKHNKNGKVEMKYKQNNKYGRFMACNGYQGFKRDVRKYLNNEYDRDIDIYNCHPIILQHIFKEHNIECGDFLREYNENRKQVMTKYNIEDKLEFIKAMNNENLNNPVFKETHTLIYNNLVPILIKNNKAVYDRNKKERIKKKKNYNFSGSFLSLYLQNIENQILMMMYKHLTEKGFTVSTLCFDGCLVEDVEELTDNVLREMETVIYNTMKYKMRLTFKSMKTDWKPLPVENVPLVDENLKYLEDIEYSKAVNKKLYDNCFEFTDDDPPKVIFSPE